MLRRKLGPVMVVVLRRSFDGGVELSVERADGRDAPGSGFALDFEPEGWATFRAAVLDFDPARLEPDRLPL